MKRFISLIGTIFLALTLTACNFDGTYRYPCQDPANWDKDECKPPICTVNGACPEDLVGNILNKDNSSGDTIVEEPLPEEGE